MKMKEKIKKYFFKYLVITIGVIISSLALECILLPNGLIDGGITGVSIVLNNIIPINLSVIIVVLNIPLVLCGLKSLGVRFTCKAIYAMVGYSICLEIFSQFQPFIHDKFIATIFGGGFLGIGIGLVMYAGGCMDGTEVIAVILDKKIELSIGQIVLIFNVLIFTVSSLVFGFDKALYSLTAYFISCKIIDKVSSGFEQMKVAVIITRIDSDIPKMIYTKMGRTVTSWTSLGLASMQENMTIYCVITRVEVATLKEIVNENEDSAFVTILDANEIVGQHIKKKSAEVIKSVGKLGIKAKE